MPDRRGFRHLLTAVSLLSLIVATGCEETPTIYESDAPAVEGGVQFELADYELRYLELTDDEGETIEYPDPVLAVGVEVTNAGENPFQYNPTHQARQISQADTPMLYDYQAPDDPETIDWENFSPEPIMGVELDEGRWDRQIQESTTLAPDESLTDYFLFEPPESSQKTLTLSIPPTKHRGELPVFIQFDYEQPEPRGRTVHAIGETLEFDGVELTVTDTSQEYVELVENGEEGFSEKPVLKLSYEIENTTDEPVQYAPGHDDMTGSEGPLVRARDVGFARARFPGDPRPVDQKTETEIEPGETIRDYALFEKPSRATEAATFMLPADHFDRTGTARVDFSYEPEDVEEPEELQQD